jgi:hypothetical protein
MCANRVDGVYARGTMQGLISPKALVTGFIVGLVVAGGGLAVAHDSGTEADTTGGTASGSTNPASVPETGPEAFGFVPEREWREAHGLPPLSEDDEIDFAAEGPNPSLADACRTRGASAVGSTPLHCDAIIAVAEGRLPPGSYSDESLRAALGQ